MRDLEELSLLKRWRTDGRTNWVTTSLLELLIAAKNAISHPIILLYIISCIISYIMYILSYHISYIIAYWLIDWLIRHRSYKYDNTEDLNIGTVPTFKMDNIGNVFRAAKSVLWSCLNVSFGPFKHSFLPIHRLRQNW